ncbi:hypothetical protein E2C01_041706 [Portunus trituberculatus]|uniref:Uncharacterized protein n=1 Tax=Portunus trituberculatus TaxID=210409 RepID=A0A5B7FRD4_PORTR|nr:hypothetical protein [Portunus trituberculatus]
MESHPKSVLQFAKHSLINGKCQNLSKFNSHQNFWHLAKNISNNFTLSFLPLFHLDGSNPITFVSKAELFSQTLRGAV